ncbi:MAG: AMP-binding protein [Actinomycetota bacterium]|nr:AMP-binding protein [Actinomycetota bacterium]
MSRLGKLGGDALDVVVGGGRLLGAVAAPPRSGVGGLVRMGRALRDNGTTMAGICAIAAARRPDAVALIDDDGAVTAAELQRQISAFTGLLHDEGVAAGDAVGVMCRNGRRFVHAAMAVSRLGADLVLLNNEFAAGSLGATAAHEGLVTLIHDDEFADRVASSGFAGRTVSSERSLTADGDDSAVPRVRRPGAIVVLTSGTTGAAKGARQRETSPAQVVPITSLVRAMRLRAGEPMLVLPPMFHGYGLGFMLLGLGIGAPVVTSRRYDADRASQLAREHEVTTIVAVPPMLPQLVDALDGDSDGGRHPLPALRCVISGAGLLHPTVSEQVRLHLGDVLFNFYGSSEEGWSTLATPDDLRRAPGTIGRAVAGVEVAILGAAGMPVPDGEVGHLCVRSNLSFSGYTGGGARARRGGMLDSGDLAHRDADGLLFVDGRADGMVVTGGENVMLSEVEDALLAHPDVIDVRVDGVADEAYGTRLEASVVLSDEGRGRTDATALQRHVEDRLARFKIPRRVHFVDELAVTATGKHVRPKPT